MLWAVSNFYIGPDYGASANNVHLLDASAAFIGGQGSGPFWRYTDIGFEADMLVVGTSATDAQANADAIATMLNRARRSRGVDGIGEPVILSMELYDGTWRYLDTLDGAISPVRAYPGGTTALVTLTLVTPHFAYGDPEPEAPTATLTNGTGSAWLVEDIPGTLPALCRITGTDASTNGAIITGYHLYQRSLPWLQAGDWQHAVELTAASPGVAMTDSSSYSGANFARIAATSAWRTIAEAIKPASQFTRGLTDVILRLRDSTQTPSAPRNVAAVAATEVAAVAGWENTDAASGTSIAATLTPAPTAGNLLIVTVGYEGNTPPTNPAGFTLATDGVDTALVTNTTPTPDVQLAVYWKVADGTETSVSVTTGTATNRAISVAEWRGMATSSVVEQVAADATGFGAIATSGTVTTTQVFQLILRAAYHNANGTSTGGIGLGLARTATVATTAGAQAAGAFTFSGGSGDWAATMVTFKAASTTAPVITGGTWQVLVIAEAADGSLSPVSEVIQIPVGAAPSTYLTVTWDDPTAGTPTNYQVWRNRGSGWGYVNAGDVNSYTFTTESGITTGTPDYDGSPLAQFRIQVARANGVVVFESDPFTGRLANGFWEDAQDEDGTPPHLPPIPRLDDDPDEDWLLRVQGRHDTGNPNLDVDIVWLAPQNEHQWQVEQAGHDLAAAVDWIIDQRRNGQRSVRLNDPSTGEDAGQGVWRHGRSLIGPGTAELAARMTVAGGGSDVDDAKSVFTVRWVPRWLLPGRQGW